MLTVTPLRGAGARGWLTIDHPPGITTYRNWSRRTEVVLRAPGIDTRFYDSRRGRLFHNAK